MKTHLQSVKDRLVAESPRSARDVLLEDLVSEVCDTVAARSALLLKLGQVCQTYEADTVDKYLDQDVWRGVAELMRANREDLTRLMVSIHLRTKNGGAR